MSIYYNETKLYPDLNPSAPQKPQAHQLKKLTEIEAFFLDEIEACRRETKKKKRLNTIIGIVDTGLITSAVIAGGASIPTFASGAGLPAGAALDGLGVVLSLLMVATRHFSRSQTVKQGKNHAIVLLAQSKLDSIADIIHRQCKTETSRPPNFTKYCKKGKNIVNLKSILETEPSPK